MLLEEFHFLRPWWLLALLPLALLLWRLAVVARTDLAWMKVVEPRLLARLMVRDGARPRRRPLALVAAGALAAVIALAGPTWEKLPQPAWQADTPLVVALGITPSMGQGDLVPDRLARARFKLRDLLAQRDEGRTGLVIYAGEPFVVAPLTDDVQVIDAQVPVLRHDVMPGLLHGSGSDRPETDRPDTDRPDRAIAEAAALLRQAGEGPGRILLLADGAGAQPEATRAAAASARDQGYPVDVLAVLPATGPVPPALAAIAEAGGGRVVRLTPDDADIRTLLSQTDPAAARMAMTDRQADAWADRGYWLLLLPLLLAPLAFRRGLVAVLVPASLGLGLLLAPADGARAAAPAAERQETAPMPTGPAQDGSAPAAWVDPGIWRDIELWNDLWASRDRQGAAALAAGKAARAATLFEDPLWRATALHRAGHHDAAAALLADREDLHSAYNRGTALAHAGRIEEAIAAYDQVLAADPDHADARHNRDILQDLLDQAAQDNAEDDQGQQDQAGQDQGQQDQGQQDQGQVQAGQDQSGQDQSGQDQAGQDQAGQDQNGQDQAGQEPGGEDPSGTNQAGADPSDQDPAPGEQEHAEARAGAGDDRADRPEPGPAEPAAMAAPEGMEDQEQALQEGIDRAQAAGSEVTDPGASDPEVTDPAGEPAPAAMTEAMVSERDQALEQMLARVQDDPGALLRERLRRKYLEDRYGRH